MLHYISGARVRRGLIESSASDTADRAASSRWALAARVWWLWVTEIALLVAGCCCKVIIAQCVVWINAEHKQNNSWC